MSNDHRSEEWYPFEEPKEKGGETIKHRVQIAVAGTALAVSFVALTPDSATEMAKMFSVTAAGWVAVDAVGKLIDGVEGAANKLSETEWSSLGESLKKNTWGKLSGFAGKTWRGFLGVLPEIHTKREMARREKERVKLEEKVESNVSMLAEKRERIADNSVELKKLSVENKILTTFMTLSDEYLPSKFAELRSGGYQNLRDEDIKLRMLYVAGTLDTVEDKQIPVREARYLLIDKLRERKGRRGEEMDGNMIMKELLDLEEATGVGLTSNDVLGWSQNYADSENFWKWQSPRRR